MILHALAAACFAFFMLDVVRWQRIKLIARKPFNCMPCLSAWAGLAIGLCNGYGWQSLEVMFLSGVMGIILDALIKKYL